MRHYSNTFKMKSHITHLLFHHNSNKSQPNRFSTEIENFKLISICTIIPSNSFAKQQKVPAPTPNVYNWSVFLAEQIILNGNSHYSQPLAILDTADGSGDSYLEATASLSTQQNYGQHSISKRYPNTHLWQSHHLDLYLSA